MRNVCLPPLGTQGAAAQGSESDWLGTAAEATQTTAGAWRAQALGQPFDPRDLVGWVGDSSARRAAPNAPPSMGGRPAACSAACRTRRRAGRGSRRTRRRAATPTGSAPCSTTSAPSPRGWRTPGWDSRCRVATLPNYGHGVLVSTFPIWQVLRRDATGAHALDHALRKRQPKAARRSCLIWS